MKNKITGQEEVNIGKASGSHCWGSCEGLSSSFESRLVLSNTHPTLLSIKVCTKVSVTLHWFFSVCPRKTVFYIRFAHRGWKGLSSRTKCRLSWRTQKYKEETRSCNHAESREVTAYKYSSSCTVPKCLSRNLSKNPFACLHCSKLTCHVKCINFSGGLPTALYTELLPSLLSVYFPPWWLQGRDLCDSACFQRHSGITLSGFRAAGSLKLS